jgi:bacterioferritin-associated ferredoxin
LGVGGSCGKCNPDVKELLNDHSRNQTLMQNNANPSILAA